MKIGIPIICVGAAMLFSGIVFFLQGNSIVGPKSSFMYANPQWITNGQWIAIIGIIILVIGIAVSSLRYPK